ncbi:MAG TPA: hypothetical protein VGN04_00255 [Herbaspirillum sp.]
MPVNPATSSWRQSGSGPLFRTNYKQPEYGNVSHIHSPEATMLDNNTTPPNDTRSSFNLERIHALIAELEIELANAPPGADLQDVRDEIETLKNVLKSPKVKEGWIRESLQSVRNGIEDMTQTVEGTVLKDSPSIAEIGRILGLM